MSGGEIVFFVAAALAVFSALAMVTRRNVIVAAMWLIACFFAVAVCYLLLEATFLSVIQVLVYAGAIMVLFVFVIMVLDVDATGQLAQRRPSRAGRWIYGASFLTAGGFLAWVMIGTWARQYAHPGPELGGEGFGTADAVGRQIFTRFLFPFEAISLLLLAAVIGAVVVARSRKEREQAGEDMTDASARRAAGLAARDDPESQTADMQAGVTPVADFGQPSGTGHRGA